MEYLQVRTFLYLEWLPANTDQKKTVYLDTFHAAQKQFKKVKIVFIR